MATSGGRGHSVNGRGHNDWAWPPNRRRRFWRGVVTFDGAWPVGGRGRWAWSLNCQVHDRWEVKRWSREVFPGR